jgi:hypothetical protein
VTLQGGLDSFPLPDVLRLLAATGKTGGLHVVGPTASGSIWVVDGRIEHAALGGEGCEPHEAVFALLRNVDGTFRYEAGVPVTVPSSAEAGPVEVEGVLAAAAVLLQEWDELGRVVPGADARLHLSPELVRPVRLTVEEWAVIVAVGGGTRVQELATALGVPEIVAMRRARDLVVAGLLTATPADPHAAPVPIEDLLAAVQHPGARAEPEDPRDDVAPAERPRPVASSPEVPEPIVPGTLDAEDWAEADAASSFAVWDPEPSRDVAPSWDPEPSWDAAPSWEPDPSWGPEPSWGAAPSSQDTEPCAPEAQPSPGEEHPWETAPAAAAGGWSPDAWASSHDPAGAGLPAALLPLQLRSPAPVLPPPPSAAAPSGEEEDGEIDRSLLLRFLGAVED